MEALLNEGEVAQQELVVGVAKVSVRADAQLPAEGVVAVAAKAGVMTGALQGRCVGFEQHFWFVALRVNFPNKRGSAPKTLQSGMKPNKPSNDATEGDQQRALSQAKSEQFRYNECKHSQGVSPPLDRLPCQAPGSVA